jgi:hypothetical protein
VINLMRISVVLFGICLFLPSDGMKKTVRRNGEKYLSESLFMETQIADTMSKTMVTAA